MKKEVVFVGLSGGVDSAVSAALLKEKGFEVVGVFIKTWHPDFLECNEEEERRDAMRVAAFLDIPFLTFDLENVYKKEVADYMISEYKKGRTPNPDVMCNKEVKFGAFLKKALSMGADYVATGHYAQSQGMVNFARGRFQSRALRTGVIRKNSSFPKISLLQSVDPSKDQSYFLWTLRQEQISKILFPVGGFQKSEVRKLATKFKLPVAEKKDSQGICFLGAVDLKEFLKHYIKEKKGKVVLAPSAGNEKGEEIGWHNGVVFSTLGERHGFTITKKSPNDKPYYVVAKDLNKNTLIVSQQKTNNSSAFLHPAGGTFRSKNSLFSVVIENTNWISEVPVEGKDYTAQIRYHGEFLPCKIKITGKDTAEVIFNKPVLVASGQSCVVYDKAVCLGGGVII
ncbi:MAG: tRNA 2-thiouridine(34) synthase MnmA [Candidatus Pacebacteria bacterium]|nr:tRNA 2-thiouridine(34) synthase MnmA [Candidatus Paceibacterota bacterium]